MEKLLNLFLELFSAAFFAFAIIGFLNMHFGITQASHSNILGVGIFSGLGIACYLLSKHEY